MGGGASATFTSLHWGMYHARHVSLGKTRSGSVACNCHQMSLPANAVLSLGICPSQGLACALVLHYRAQAAFRLCTGVDVRSGAFGGAQRELGRGARLPTKILTLMREDFAWLASLGRFGSLRSVCRVLEEERVGWGEIPCALLAQQAKVFVMLAPTSHACNFMLCTSVELFLVFCLLCLHSSYPALLVGVFCAAWYLLPLPRWGP